MARRTTRLSDLPPELLEALAVVQPPSTLCALTIALPHARLDNEAIWSRVCERTLGASKPVPDATAALALARSLTCNWHAASGALVRGVPVHFRRGFIAVRERGSTTLTRIRSSSDASALVMGGPDDGHGAHSPPPALECDFALSPTGPFPVDGMTVRVTGAPVPAQPSARSPPPSPLARSPTARSPPIWTPLARAHFPPRLPSASALRAEGQRQRDALAAEAVDDVCATFRVLLNGTAVATRSVDELCAFKSFEIALPARLLRRKPQMNTLCVEYVSGSSTAALWLREVHMVAAVLPLNDAPRFENVPLRHVGRSVHEAAVGLSKRARNIDSAYPSFTRIRGC